MSFWSERVIQLAAELKAAQSNVLKVAMGEKRIEYDRISALTSEYTQAVDNANIESGAVSLRTKARNAGRN